MDSDEFLHGMEQVIGSVLQRARRDSPVYWTHSHRYVASDSVWCEQQSDPQTAGAPAGAFAETEWRGHAFAGEEVRASTLESTVFVGDLSATCLCGWHAGALCHIPIACDSLAPPPGLAPTWLRLCAQGTSTREQDTQVTSAISLRFYLV